MSLNNDKMTLPGISIAPLNFKDNISLPIHDKSVAFGLQGKDVKSMSSQEFVSSAT